jgi:hypothetical protein
MWISTNSRGECVDFSPPGWVDRLIAISNLENLAASFLAFGNVATFANFFVDFIASACWRSKSKSAGYC